MARLLLLLLPIGILLTFVQCELVSSDPKEIGYHEKRSMRIDFRQCCPFFFPMFQTLSLSPTIHSFIENP
jgi:hypothetical protein